jgi:uncharacterized protein with HEPN domain
MTRGDDQRIADILDACQELATIVAIRASGSTDSQVLVRAAERLLEIIGEAANNVSEATQSEFPSVDWRNIARLRIVLAHHYHRTDPDLIWSYATEQVPLLAQGLRSRS